MFVTPIGWRNFLSSCILLIMLTIQLLGYLEFNLENSITTIVVYAINLFLVIFMLLVFTSVGIYGINRTEVIESQIRENKKYYICT